MRPQGAKFWRIGGLNGWSRQTASATLAVSDAHGLRLAGDPAGPLSLGSADGSAGGLVPPRRMAFDEQNTLYLLVTEGSDAPGIKRFDPETRTFARLPEVGGNGSAARQFSDPQSIAIAGRRLYVADTGNHRVQAFDLESLALVELLESDWTPVDVAAHRGSIYILDSAHARVWRRTVTGHVVPEFAVAGKEGQWSRVLLDKNGGIYLLNASHPDAPVLDRPDPSAPPVADAGNVRDLFEPPALRLDERGRFCLPESLTRICGRKPPAAPPAPDQQLALCPPFNRQAQRCAAKPNATRSTRTAQGAWLLYVVEREQLTVNAFTGHGRRLRHSWGACMDWQPCDVAARGAAAFILDEKNQAVYRHQAAYDNLRLILQDDSGQTFWSRIAADPAGCIYLWSPGRGEVQAYDCKGAAMGQRCYREVARYFEAVSPEAPPAAGTGLYFDRNGAAIASVDPSDPSGIPFYRTSGRWQSKPLDSLEYRCQWHRIEIGLSSFPPSSKISVYTFAHDHTDDVRTAPDEAWKHAESLVAPVQPPPCDPPGIKTFDFLVQSGLGQLLSVRVDISADGFHTPAIETLKVHYPRQSYLQYLPANYSEDDEGRVFLERFLSIFQTEWDGFDAIIDQVERYFDPDAVPAGPVLDYLAGQWLGIPMEQTWSEQQKRRLLSAIPKIYPHRGQLTGLRDFIAVYLANLSGIDTADIQRAGFPVILEGFREREYLFLAGGDAARLDQGAALWSNSVERRLQLGVFSQVGEVDLVSTGDPEHDVFDRYAHRFRIGIPAAWVKSADDERLLRRGIDAEKPAHTAYDLCLLGARFRVGEQSTVGVDTIIGGVPATWLGCGPCEDLAPSLPPSGRLGYDTILNAAAGGNEMRLAPGIILGSRSVLA